MTAACSLRKYLDTHKRELHPCWKPELTDEERQGRRGLFESLMWKETVSRRDNYTCQICGNMRNLNAHHIFPWATHKDRRFNINNGITLCFECHMFAHEVIRMNNKLKELVA